MTLAATSYLDVAAGAFITAVIVGIVAGFWKFVPWAVKQGLDELLDEKLEAIERRQDARTDRLEARQTETAGLVDRLHMTLTEHTNEEVELVRSAVAEAVVPLESRLTRIEARLDAADL